jgi:transcriptional regulator with XRE-family HTH domain
MPRQWPGPPQGLIRCSGGRAKSHTAVSRLESGTHTPNLATLQKIAAVLDEELLVCFQRTVDGEVERDFAAVA